MFMHITLLLDVYLLYSNVIYWPPFNDHYYHDQLTLVGNYIWSKNKDKNNLNLASSSKIRKLWYLLMKSNNDQVCRGPKKIHHFSNNF